MVDSTAPQGTDDVPHVIKILEDYRAEAKASKFERMQKNKDNFATYHQRQDWLHKKEGQSREFLPKMDIAVEQISSFIQQGLMDVGDWFRVEPQLGVDTRKMKIKPETVEAITRWQLEKAGMAPFMNDCLKLGLIGSLMISKVHGEYVPKPRYVVDNILENKRYVKRLSLQKKDVWQLKLDTVRQEDWYPDPEGRGLYILQDVYLDYYQLLKMAEAENSPYDRAEIDRLAFDFGEDTEQRARKVRETGQNAGKATYRKQIIMTEMWGHIIEPITGKVLNENVVCAYANRRRLIRVPQANPFWHQMNPFVVSPIIRVPHSVWGKAVMDAPTMLNRALNELFNLIVDGGMMSVHGIKQFRPDWISNLDRFSDGFAPGDSVPASAACPPGGKVVERVDTGVVPPEALQVFNVVQQEFNASSYTNDLRFGTVPFRQVKATEVVEASQSLSGVFAGLAKNVEVSYVEKIVALAWMTIAQHIKEVDPEELADIVGEDEAKKIFAMSPEEIFAETVQGYRFKVYGITRTLNKIKDFRKLQGLLQTIAGDPILAEQFSKKYDFSKLLDEIMRSLDIETDKLQLPMEEMSEGPDSPQSQAMGAQQGAANLQSQIPQGGAQVNAESAGPAVQRGGSMTGGLNKGQSQ